MPYRGGLVVSAFIILWCGVIAGAVIDRAARPETAEPPKLEVVEKVIVIMEDANGNKYMFYFKDDQQFKMERLPPRGTVPQPRYSHGRKGCA